MAFYFARQRLFSLAHYDGQLSNTNGNIMPSYLPQLATVGSDTLDGSYLGLHYRIPLTQEKLLDINGRIGTEQLIRGTVTLSRPFSLLPHGANGTIALVVGYHESVDNLITGTDAKTNVAYNELTISRLPVLNATMAPLHLPDGLHNFTLRLGGGLGEYSEQPTGVTAFRGQFWGIFDTRRFRLGPLDLYGEYGARSAIYAKSTLSTTVTKVSLETPLTSPIYANMSYFHRQDTGSTPFLFDQVLIPDEAYTEMSVPIFKSPFYLDILNREDLSVWSSRDFQVSLLYANDCMAYGLSFDTVTKGFNFQFQFAKKGPYHRGVSGVGFTQ
jgi:hypothetical protein